MCQIANAASVNDPSNIGVGARSMGLGKACIAKSDDSSSVFINPSGLVRMNRAGFSSMRASLIGDVNYTVLTAAAPVTFGYVGIGYILSSISNIPLTRWTNSAGVERPEIYGNTEYYSGVLGISYANSLGAIFKNKRLNNISIGTTLKYFNQSFSYNLGSLEAASGSGIDLDIGLKWQVNNWLDMGLVATNILPKNWGGDFVWSRNAISETIPSSIKAAAAIKMPAAVTWLIDCEQNIDQFDNPLLLHSGIEWKPSKMLAIRAGLDQQQKASISKMETETNFTCGVGLNISQYSFDYAYHQYGELSDNTTHYFSIGYCFDNRNNQRDVIE